MLLNKKILYPELSYRINRLLFETHNRLGRYRNEKQYADFFESLLKENGIKYAREYALPPSFPGEKQGRNIIDFIVEDKIIIEFKAKDIITKDDYFQVQRYLVSANKELGMAVNFRQKVLRPKRILNVSLFKK
jgi:GxxExxY protein